MTDSKSVEILDPRILARNKVILHIAYCDNCNHSLCPEGMSVVYALKHRHEDSQGIVRAINTALEMLFPGSEQG